MIYKLRYKCGVSEGAFDSRMGSPSTGKWKWTTQGWSLPLLSQINWNIWLLYLPVFWCNCWKLIQLGGWQHSKWWFLLAQQCRYFSYLAPGYRVEKVVSFLMWLNLREAKGLPNFLQLNQGDMSIENYTHRFYHPVIWFSRVQGMLWFPFLGRGWCCCLCPT